ncbi:hypothetical protein [Salinarimonas sp.]|uniref:hypothetical protein n=1 Tax=Salinarimonas sp. TaxID=2766526 RepID=UPI0032D98BE1
MHKQMVLTAVVLLAKIDVLSASNPEYKCEPGTVSRDAVAVAYSDVDVSAYSNRDAGICTFAVGGADKEGATISSEAQPIEDVLRSALSGETLPLARRLSTARSIVEKRSSELDEFIASLLNEGEIGACIEALFEASAGDYMDIDTGEVRISCVVVQPGESEFFITTEQTMHLRSRVGRTGDSLFIPAPALQ